MSQFIGDPNVDEMLNEETGLNLFDDRASAAGTFPTSMMGYSRSDVDRYVREIEQQVSTLKQLARQLRREVVVAQNAAGTTDLTKLGSHATGILRAAESQAQDLVTKAQLEAERIKEEGRRVAADLRANAQAEADDIRVAGLANLRELRTEQDKQAETTLKQARTQAASVVAAGQREAEARTLEAQGNAGNIIEAAKAEANRVRQQAERDAAAALLEARTQAEQLLSQAQNDHLEAKDRAAQLLAEATRHHEASANHLTTESENARQIRADALAEAEQIKVAAARESETQIATAHRQAALMKDRLEEQYAWRKEQLEREVAALLQRKASVLAQLQNLRELAGQTKLDFPDEDPFAGFEPDESSRPAPRPRASDPADVEPTVMVSRADVEQTTVLAPVGGDAAPTTVMDAVDDDETAVRPAITD